MSDIKYAVGDKDGLGMFAETMPYDEAMTLARDRAGSGISTVVYKVIPIAGFRATVTVEETPCLAV